MVNYKKNISVFFDLVFKAQKPILNPHENNVYYQILQIFYTKYEKYHKTNVLKEYYDLIYHVCNRNEKGNVELIICYFVLLTWDISEF